MSVKEIEIYRIAETKIIQQAHEGWLQSMGVDCDNFYDNADGLKDSELLVASAGKRCYKSFQVGLNKNISRIREDYVEYFDNILKSGHGSVLEHAYFSYAIENVTRVFTAEMNRHRAGMAISEGSMRFIRFDQDIPYWLPLSIREQREDNPELAERKRRTREIFDTVFDEIQEHYAELIEIWNMDESDKNFKYKKEVTSCLRRIVPLGCCTGGVWTGNVRALRHIMNMRCSPVAEEEIRYVFSAIAFDLSEAYPHFFGDFKCVDGYWKPTYPKV